MFEIIQKTFGKFTELILSNQATGEYVSIIPDYGAALNRLSLKKGNQNYNLILGAKNYKQFVQQSIPIYAGVKLFPFPNRVSKGQFDINNISYQLPINDTEFGNSLHGLTYDKKFEINYKNSNSEHADITLTYHNKEDKNLYPFSYRLEVTYRLDSEGLKVSTQITNLGNKAMPYGDGWHPYFSTGTSVDLLQLEIPSNKYLIANNMLIPDGNWGNSESHSKKAPIANHQFNECYLIENDGIAQTTIYDPVKNIEIICWQKSSENGYNYVQLYTPDDRMSIAIEPMTCAPDAINNLMGLIHLNPKESHILEYGINIR